ncbi:hypothetical protein V6Z12_D04G099000 [Gossypium hirsutum]
MLEFRVIWPLIVSFRTTLWLKFKFYIVTEIPFSRISKSFHL